MFTRSKRLTRRSALALTLALIATACGGGSAATDVAAPDEAVPEQASTDDAVATEAPAEAAGPGLPQLIGTTVAGAQFDTNDLAGQDIVIWFWAPW